MKNFMLMIATICIFAACNLLALSPSQEIFEKANRHYKAGNYDAATELYTKILLSGNHSSELYYNLGNAYYKAGNFPKSILNYEKAKLLNPGDADIDLNLRIARGKIVDRIPVIEPFFLYSWANSFAACRDSDGWASVVFGFFVFMLVLLAMKMFAVRRWKRRAYFIGACVAGFGVIIALACSIYRLNIETAKDTAIVMTPVVDLKSGLDPAAETSFVLHEGTKVFILDTKDNWYKIKISDGRQAWIPAKDVETI